MMLLADIGNSRIKWALANADTIGGSAAAVYEDHTLADVLDHQWRSLDRPHAVTYCCVGAAAASDELERWVREAWGMETIRARPSASGHGVRCAYANPYSLGADRWAALVATHHKYRRAACIVDCGTAVTLDALSVDGVHLGGVIFPGVELMRQTLSAGTDGIPPEVDDDLCVLASSTRAGLGAGTIYAAAAGVDRIAAEMRSSLTADSVTLLTGGGAGRLAPLLSTEHVRDPDLVLYGLAVIAGAFE